MLVLFMIYQTLLRILVIRLKTSCVCFCVFLLLQCKLPSQMNTVKVSKCSAATIWSVSLSFSQKAWTQGWWSSKDLLCSHGVQLARIMCYKIITIKKPCLCIAYMTKAKAENEAFIMDHSGTKKTQQVGF